MPSFLLFLKYLAEINYSRQTLIVFLKMGFRGFLIKFQVLLKVLQDFKNVLLLLKAHD